VIHYTLATQDDDDALRSLLRENDMPAWVNISLEREPSFFAGKNPVTQEFAVIARSNNALVGMYTYAIQQVYCNEHASSLGYLGGLRVHKSYRNQLRVLKGGFASIDYLMPPSKNTFYFTSVGSENVKARRLLEAGVSGLPKYLLAGEIVTFALSITQGKASTNGWRVLTEEDIPAVLAFHAQQAIQYQFSPVLNEHIIRYIGLNNFWIHYDNGIEACAAIWDQSAYKQIVARQYRFPIDVLRPLYNIYARFTKRPCLPAVGTQISCCYFAYAAFSNNVLHKGLELIKDLLRYCYTESAIIGFHANHPMIKICQSLNALSYKTRIYVVGEQPVDFLEPKPVQPEIAFL
jgi:hypothetical protein